MNEYIIAKGIIFQKMRLSNESFEDRLISQKKIYLLESLGIDLGYKYNWYTRGPYSPSLAIDLETTLDILKANNYAKTYKLNDNVEKNIKKVKFFEKKKNENMKTAEWYELLASLLYIYTNKESWKIDISNKNSLFEKLIAYKSKYDINQCEFAFNILTEQKFIKSEAIGDR
ncbi:hypothetical protein [Fusobacterium sp.]|uniref:hypothetical protein n=1 Tax=Fusobacterium sp. TaxID=68766 RepID=UPI0029035C3F|nr:hypothetical protein [Fusobacterium sp.]MDU1911928.1 hypothetical protein [Fusobacterium sp.]